MWVQTRWCRVVGGSVGVGGRLTRSRAQALFLWHVSYRKDGVTLVERTQMAQPEGAELRRCQRCFDFVTQKLLGMEVKGVVEKVHGDDDLKTEIHEALSRTEPLPDLDVSAIDVIEGEVVSK